MAHVLAVDDDPSILKLIEMILLREGFSVTTCIDAQDALIYLQTTLPDIVVSDMRMPSLSGLEFLQEIRKDPRLAQVPFLFLSSYAERADVRSGMMFGADDYLAKPFQAKELVEAIRVRLERVVELRGKEEEIMEDPLRLRIQSMGEFRVIYQGQTVAWAARKAAELFFYLLETGSASSWEVAEALWPDKDEEKASSLFHTTLHRLRKSLFSEVVDSNNRRYSLLHSLKIDYDVAKYRQQSQHALAQFELNPLLSAIPLYGEYLMDFDSEWCQGVRNQLAQTQIRMHEQASELRQGLGQINQAVTHLEQAVQLDPLRDATWHHLERLLRLSKDPRAESAALRIPWWLN